ncbi:hypothetical protein HWV62_2729 [Athelia sp. TMB]|nr:hypothetical protein HWV62_2729 [Athelia sp. TMB]
MSDTRHTGSLDDPFEATNNPTRPDRDLASNSEVGGSLLGATEDDSSTIRTHQSPPYISANSGTSGDRPMANRSPISPSPGRPGPSELHPGAGLNTQTSEVRNLPVVVPATSNTLTSLSSPPTVQFSSLEGRIPAEQIHSLRVFMSHHALQNQKLRLTDDHLGNLNSEVRELREHAGSLTRRIDRAMSDNARFLVESESQISELARMFDTPFEQHTAPAENRRPSVIDANGSLVQLSTAPILQPTTVPPPIRAVDDSASQHQGAPQIPTGGLHGRTLSPRPTRSVSSRSSLPPQQPGESIDQYEARYDANIRRVTHTQDSWARGYGMQNRTEGTAHSRNPDSGMGSTHAALPGPPHRDVRLDTMGYRERIPQATQNPVDGPLFDSISRPPNPYAGISAPPIGTSAYRVTQGPVTNGLWSNDHYHYVVLLGRVTQLVNHKVGEPFEVPPGFKQPKLHEPSKYAGSHSHDDFMDWLSEFLNWLRGHYICGPATDPVRIVYLGLFITGTASDWFLTEIDNPARHYEPPLTFANCVCLLHKRFVRTATANEAAVKYNAVRYSTTEGVEGLFYRLDRAAERMIERPNDYDFRRRLFNLLPKWLHDKLKDRNQIPEYCTLEDIRENAKQLEENALRVYEGVGDSNTPAVRTAAPRDTRTANRPTRPSAVSRATPDTSGVDRTGNGRSAPTPRPRDARDTGATRNRDRLPRDTSKLNCFGCGKLGHISSDPTCENYDANKARLHMQHEVAEDDLAEEPALEGEERGDDVDDDVYSWGGSQYDPEEADEVLEGPEVARVAAMYTVRVAAMRVIDEDALDEAHNGDTDSDGENMPPLQDCSDSEDEDNSVPNGGRAPTILRTDRGSRLIVDYRSSEGLTLSQVPLGERYSVHSFEYLTLNPPSRTYPAGSAQAVESEWARGSLTDWDNGPHIDTNQWASPRCAAPYIRYTGEGTTDPSEHLPTPSTTRPVSQSVWMDTQERIMEFAEVEHLDQYNRCISQLVECFACGNRCRPTVFQRLARLPLGPHPATYLTTFICHFAGRSRIPTVTTLEPQVQYYDEDYPGSDDDIEGGAEDYGDPDSYVDDGDESYGPLGEYSSSLYAMRAEQSSNIRRPAPPTGAITRPLHSQATISLMVTINGHQALALFDSGSTTDSITPEFGFTSRTRQFKLDEQVTLQLGCVGSRSKIVYGAVAPVSIVGISEEMYFDIVNIDKYDAILGTPFLQRHGILLDFKRSGVLAKGEFFKSFSLADELAFLAKKGGGEHDEDTS